MSDLTVYLELKKLFDQIQDYQAKLGDAMAHLITQFESKTSSIINNLNDINIKLANISGKEDKMMATLDEILADVQAEPSLIASLTTLIGGLQQQLNDVLAGNLPPAVQQKVDAIFAAAEANKQALADAVAANTPAAPAPTP